jgi:hypothetical protein
MFRFEAHRARKSVVIVAGYQNLNVGVVTGPDSFAHGMPTLTTELHGGSGDKVNAVMSGGAASGFAELPSKSSCFARKRTGRYDGDVPGEIALNRM